MTATVMNWIDYILIAIIFLSLIAGFVRGFVREVISLLTLVAAFIVASMFSNALAAYFTSSPSVQNVVNQTSTSIGINTTQPVSYLSIGISFGLLFIATLLVGAIVGFILNMAFQTGILGIGNRILGGVFGLARGILITLVIIFVVQLTPFGTSATWQQSVLVAYFQPGVIWLGNIVSPSLANLKDRFGNAIQNMNSQMRNVGQGIYQ